jgi:hypothetical protein
VNGAGATLDLECVCGDSLCPIGVATNCNDAQKLLGAQSALLVCQQVNDGRCVTLSVDAGNSGGATSTTCDHTCQSECGGDPSCMQICGC